MKEAVDSISLAPGAAGINVLNERPLHAATKQWIARPGDRLEWPVDGYIIDIVRGDLLIEVQTSNFGAIRDKLTDLCLRHPVRLVHPITVEKWILTRLGEGSERRRKSPRRGFVEDLFYELVHLPLLMAEGNFSLEVLLIQEEEVRCPSPPRGRWRKAWIREERRLLRVLERRVFRTPSDLVNLLPASVPDPFTAGDVARLSGRPLPLAQKLVYSLRRLGALDACGRSGRSVLYTRAVRTRGSLVS